MINKIKSNHETKPVLIKKLADKLNISGIDAYMGIPDIKLATLISAAPEMLEALENILGHYYDDCVCDSESVCTFCRIKSDIEPLIKKARGE